jgi:UDP-glucose-4-epimerase GalE
MSSTALVELRIDPANPIAQSSIRFDSYLFHSTFYFNNFSLHDMGAMSNHHKFVLVTGGAGYIGSHAAKALAASGFVPVSYDNLIHGHRWAVKWGPFVEGDISDRAKLLDTIRRYDITAILHFAGFAYVGESTAHPERYFNNNVVGSLAVFDTAIEAGVRHIVFSSTCATYGIPEILPITENAPQFPVNPYGETKLVIERALRWYAAAHPLTYAALRYFNAAGADPDGELGEMHEPETHLIPLVLDAALGHKTLEIFGGDYRTSDGTCVRDYIHVTDLANAHVLALQYLIQGGSSIGLNLGTGEGHTILDVIHSVQKVTGREVLHRFAARRPGDPPILIADPSLAERTLGWHHRHSDLQSIIQTAWAWRSAQIDNRQIVTTG